MDGRTTGHTRFSAETLNPNAFAFVYRLVLARTTPHTPNIVANKETVLKRKFIPSRKHPCNHQANDSVLVWGQQHYFGKFSWIVDHPIPVGVGWQNTWIKKGAQIVSGFQVWWMEVVEVPRAWHSVMFGVWKLQTKWVPKLVRPTMKNMYRS
jgi:hypothetical protein